MKDLAGNESQCERSVPLGEGLQVTGIPPEENVPGKENIVPAVAPASPPSGYVNIRSDFLKEMDMQFRPFGAERLEMARTEVPEKAWRLFLKEKGLPRPESTDASTARPMTFEGGGQPAQLPDFAKWFQEKARDGYAYSVPTVGQWLCAFGGTNDVQAAKEEIREWFRVRFKAPGSYHYFTNEVYDRGSRPENETATRLLDMESNLQEVVVDDLAGVSVFGVIGAYNRISEQGDMLDHCLRARHYNPFHMRFTGFRLCRRPLEE
jgi:hypothetical protein